MEERYLCKAKRLDNGEWVIGYVVKYGMMTVIIVRIVDRISTGAI